MIHCPEGTTLKHNFLDQSNKQLLDLRDGFKANLKNPACAATVEPVSETLRQIDQELTHRGISFNKQKQAA